MKNCLLVLAFSFCNSAFAQLETVPYVDVSQYLGVWYQVAGNPLPFDRDCFCSRQKLSAKEDGTVEVYNTCNKGAIDGALSEIKGIATSLDPVGNSKFEVDFSLPFKGQYWIIGLDPQYRFAVVSDPSKRSLYILSRTPELDSVLYEQALVEAEKQVSTSNLVSMVQLNCQYP